MLACLDRPACLFLFLSSAVQSAGLMLLCHMGLKAYCTDHLGLLVSPLCTCEPSLSRVL